MPLQRIPGAMVSDSTITGADVQDGSLGRNDIGESMIRLGATQATTSGVAKEFTGIPSWARRVTLHFWFVSTNGTANLLVQLGTGGAPTTSGYTGHGTFSSASSVAPISSVNGIPIFSNAAGFSHFGTLTFNNVSGNSWVASGSLVTGGTQGSTISGGFIELAGALDYLRIVTANGTDAFDQGAVNITWE